MSDGRRGSLFGTSLTAPMSFGGNSLGGSFAPMSISGNSYGRSPFMGGQSFRFYAAGTSASSWRGGASGFGGTGMSYGRDSAMEYVAIFHPYSLCRTFPPTIGLLRSGAHDCGRY